FDAEKLVILRDTVRAAEGAGFDLAAVRGHGDVGDGGVLSFTGAVGEHACVACFLSHFDSVECLSKGTNLVHLNEDGVGNFGLDTLLEELHVGYEKIVANELSGFAKSVGEELPAGPVAFGA